MYTDKESVVGHQVAHRVYERALETRQLGQLETIRQNPSGEHLAAAMETHGTYTAEFIASSLMLHSDVAARSATLGSCCCCEHLARMASSGFLLCFISWQFKSMCLIG